MATWSDIQRGIFAGESGGDYGALFNYQDRPDGQFSNVDLTQMTVDEALQFANPSGPYAQYVKGQVGRVATPMGAYQVVGTTLRAAKQGLGLTGNEKMTPELQDRIGKWIYKTQGTGAWAGYKGPQASAREVSPMDGQQPMQQQMPQQGPQGLMGFLRDPRTRQVLSAFSRSGVGQRLGQIAAQDVQRQEQQQIANRTAQWLASQPNGQKYADLVLSGTLSGSEAYNAWQQENAGVTGVKVGDKLVNPQTGEIIFEDSAAAEELTNEQVGIVRNLSNDLLKTYKIYDEVANGYGLISSAIKNKTGVDDYVITVAFAKILDPESVVRESEQAAVAKSGGAIDAFVKDVQNFISGTGSLPETVKNRIFETAKQRADFYFNKAQQEHTRAKTIARSAGIPTDLIDKVVPKPTPMPKITPIVAPSGEEDTRTQAAKDAGITIEIWNDMLPEEKRPFE